MKILLLYPTHISGEQPLGIMHISAVLKKEGNIVDIFEFTPFRYNFWGDRFKNVKRAFCEKLKTFQPQLIGFSSATPDYGISLELAELAKQTKKNTKVIFGGIHATVDPETTIREKAIDFICIGEGDEAIVEFVRGLENNGDVTHIKNIWAKKEGTIYRNPLRPLIQDLDSIPFPDRDILNPIYMHRPFIGASFITSRGCPFPCSYCQNKYLMRIYQNKGKFVRYRSIDNVIEEIKITVDRFKIKRVTFSDETLTLNKRRALDFCEIYGKEVKIPFVCQTRPSHFDREIAEALKEAGCVHVSMGIEAGNDRLRNEVLNRNIKREELIEAFAIAKEYGISTASFNMIGIPGETEKTIWDTININRDIQPEQMYATIFMPFRGTQLGELCEKNKWIMKKPYDASSYYFETVLELPTITRNKLFSYKMVFDLLVRLPENKLSYVKCLRWMIEKTRITRGKILPWLCPRVLIRMINLFQKITKFS